MDYCDQEFLKYLNIARQNPKFYIPLIEAQLSAFVNTKEIPLNEEIMYEANEGKSAWIEAKHFLLKQNPIQPLFQHIGLCKAADDHRKDICTHGTLDHKGSDGSTFCQRILRYCKKGPGAMAEMIGLDFNLKNRNTSQLTILSLIIDDGVTDRGHRKTIFNPIYKYLGWSTGTQDQKFVTVFNLMENKLDTLDMPMNSLYKLNPNERINKHGKRQVRILGSWQQVPLKDILNVWPEESQPNKENLKASDKVFQKKISQKHQNTRTFYQQGAKIVETTIKLFFKDGTVEEIVNKKTIYDENN